MKSKAKFYKGIEFIHVSDLPVDQQLLLQHAREPERIKILIEGKIVSNCIQYKKYSEWVSTVYATPVAPAKVDSVKQEAVPVKIVLNKA
jgi:hypothetical protein